jgi:acyl-CoA hydrolase
MPRRRTADPRAGMRATRPSGNNRGIMHLRTPSASRVEMTQIVMPTHTNGAGGVLFGGVLMQWIDVCSAVAAMRHCNGRAVTASIDRLDFLVPIHVDDIVVLQAQVNFASRTSMEVGCRVETEDPRSGERRYTTKAYLTFVALDASGRPREVPALTPRTREEKRRHAAAMSRRAERLVLAGKVKAAQAGADAASGAGAPKRVAPSAPKRVAPSAPSASSAPKRVAPSATKGRDRASKAPQPSSRRRRASRTRA